LKPELADGRPAQTGIVSKLRTLKTGEAVGGIPFTRGPLAHLLRNRFYIGEVAFKGEVLPGEQPAIVDRDLFDAVQAKLSQQINNHKTTRMKSEALLAGRIFDDRGNRMSPSHARKRCVKYRYYISSALVQGQAERVGTVGRVPATEIEALVVKSLWDHLNQKADDQDDVSVIHNHVTRVEVQPNQLVIELSNAKVLDPKQKRSAGASRCHGTRHHRPDAARFSFPTPWLQAVRPIRSENRALLVASIARGRRWLDEVVADPNATVEIIAAREGCSVRKINMTISLAPDLVKAAIDGRLPHGMGVARLCELPAEWSRQRSVLGLPAP